MIYKKESKINELILIDIISPTNWTELLNVAIINLEQPLKPFMKR